MNSAEPTTAARLNEAELAGHLDDHLRATGLLPQGASVTIALSGGLDSVVLLDLLVSLAGSWGWSLSAAHFDHRMRAESASDADWVRALCEQRDIPCVIDRANETPRNDAEGRELRYAFLHGACELLGAKLLATAHQADDQAETVLFRLIRGSGLAGLSGIRSSRSPNLVRPLLPFWREEIERYAELRGLVYLTDPSNLDLSYSRNHIRHEVIPRLEASGTPDLRSQLCRLSRLAGRAARVVDGLCETALRDMVLEASESRIVVARTGFLAYDKSVRAHLLRVLVRGIGAPPSRAGTLAGVEFISTCPSGRRTDLAGDIVIRREFDRIILERRSDRSLTRDEEVVIADGRGGEKEVEIAGARWRVRWALGALDVDDRGSEELACFDPSELQFPLSVRGWRPGDRIRLGGGTRKLKKVFVDRRVGRSERGGYPLLIDPSGVLWVVGLVQGVRAGSCAPENALTIGFRREG
jgi:tRNA(Ile)-lysidine synthase